MTGHPTTGSTSRRRARWAGSSRLVLSLAVAVSCTLPTQDEAAARDEVARVLALHRPQLVPRSRGCLAERLAAEGVDLEQLEVALAHGGDGPAQAGDDDGADTPVVVDVALAAAEAVCLTPQELLSRG